MNRASSRSALVLACAAVCASLGCAGFQRKAPESVEILSRAGTAPSASVKHILIAWSWLAPAYRKMGMELDPRAEQRNQTAAESLAAELLEKLRAGTPIEPLMKQYSEDPGSAQSGIAYTVTPDSRFAADFIDLSLRLQPGESGIVKSQFGYHVIQRVK